MYLNTNKLIENMYELYGYCLTKNDCIDLSKDIYNIMIEKNKFMIPLNEWLNGKKCFTDVVVNGFSLVDLASRLDSTNPNIPVAILILWLESQDNVFYHGLSAVADYKCFANPNIILGTKCKYAVFFNDEWYFMLDGQKNEELKEYQAWQILLLNPTLIVQVAYEHSDNTVLILQDDGSYLISVYEEDV